MACRSLVLVALALALAGCDVVFRLDDLKVDDGGTPDIAIDAGEACRADYGTVSDTPTRSKYRFVNTYLTWKEAEADCENDSATNITHLVVFDDEAELRGVRNFVIAEVVFETGGAFQAHLGYGRNLADDATEFYAVTGEALPTSGPPWQLNEPNNGMGGAPEPVVWFSREFDLVDGPTTFMTVYVCECDHRPVTNMFTLD